MKRMILLALAILMTVSLAACAARSEAQTDQSTTKISVLDQGDKNVLPPLGQLMVGTFELEGTDHAVTAEQAAALVPLWKAYRGLSDSDSASQVEMTALLDQIEGAMTEEQLDVISALELTNTEMRELMAELGIEMATGSGRLANLSEEERSAVQAQRVAGGGGVPGMGGPGGGEAPSAEQIEALRAEQGGMSGTTGFMIQGPLFDALIELLKEKA